VLHDVDNLSDHDLIFLHLRINIMLLSSSDGVYTPRLSWAAGTGKLGKYASILSQILQTTQPPVNALLCTDRCCKDSNHHSEIAYYAEAITRECVSATESPFFARGNVALCLVKYLGGVNWLNLSSEIII